MTAKSTNTQSPIVDIIVTLRKHLANKPLVTDIIAKLIMTFGVVLIVGGFYLIVIDSGFSSQSALDAAATEFAVEVVSWVPGIPINTADLGTSSVTAIGLVSWIIGVDLLLIGLGFWVRHRLARFVGLAIFGLATCFQFIQLLGGIMNSPASWALVLVNAIIGYLILSRFDDHDTGQLHPVRPQTQSSLNSSF